MSLEDYAALGVIRHGVLELSDHSAFGRAMASFADGVVLVEVKVSTEKAVRSIQANKFQWQVFELIAEDIGMTKDDVHDLMCQKFLTRTIDVVDKQTGELTQTVVTGSTSRLSRQEHAAFLDQVILWAQEWLGLDLPAREDVAS